MELVETKHEDGSKVSKQKTSPKRPRSGNASHKGGTFLGPYQWMEEIHYHMDYKRAVEEINSTENLSNNLIHLINLCKTLLGQS